MSRRRLDAELVRRGLADSRTSAQHMIAEGRVTASGVLADKAARLVLPGDPIVVAIDDGPTYVGRGGHKMAGALDNFGIDPSGWRCVDAGSSTGGFTDCLLQRGATSVIAIDVGRHQLHERLRADRRVTVREQTDIRNVTPELLGGPVPLLVADLSFISVSAVASSLVSLVSADGGRIVVLVKPQFEAGRTEVSRGRGVIRDPEIWRRTLTEAIDALNDAGASIMGAMVSPIRGAEGNVEFLVDGVVLSPAVTTGSLTDGLTGRRSSAGLANSVVEELVETEHGVR